MHSFMRPPYTEGALSFIPEPFLRIGAYNHMQAMIQALTTRICHIVVFIVVFGRGYVNVL